MTGRTLLLCALLSAGLHGPADAREREPAGREDRAADSPSRHERSQRRTPDGNGASAAAREALARNGGGRVLSVEAEGAGYRVKVLKDGEVRIHRIGAD